MFYPRTLSTFSHHSKYILISVKMHTILENKPKSLFKLSALKLLMIILLIIFCVGLFFPVISPNFYGKNFIIQLLSNSYSLVCHQSEQALVQINDNHLLVCTRCTGIYFGALLLLIIMMIKPLKVNVGLKPLFILSAPLIFDAFAVRLRIYPYSITIALITGLFFGAIVLFYILETIENSFYLQHSKKYEF